MWIRWGTTQNFFLVFADEFEKQIFITKNYWSGPIKNKIILIFTKLPFFFFLRNPPGDIIILHLCTKHLDDMIYSSWDAERDKLKLVFLGHFFPFYPLKNPKNQNFENKKKIAGDIIILHMFTKNHNYMMSGSWDTEWDKQDFLSFWAIFALLLPPVTTRKIKILKKWEKFLEISFYTFAP